MRVANKSIFVTEDVERLAEHCHVTPRWGVVGSTECGTEQRGPTQHLILKRSFVLIVVFDSLTNCGTVRMMSSLGGIGVLELIIVPFLYSQ